MKRCQDLKFAGKKKELGVDWSSTMGHFSQKILVNNQKLSASEVKYDISHGSGWVEFKYDS